MYVFSYFPFGFEGRIWDLIVSVPDHCLSFYFKTLTQQRRSQSFTKKKKKKKKNPQNNKRLEIIRVVTDKPLTLLLFCADSLAASSRTFSTLPTLEGAGLVHVVSLLTDINSSIIVMSFTIILPTSKGTGTSVKVLLQSKMFC